MKNHLFNEGNRIPTRWAPTSESGVFFSPVTPLFSAIYRGYDITPFHNDWLGPTLKVANLSHRFPSC